MLRLQAADSYVMRRSALAEKRTYRRTFVYGVTH